MSQAIGAEKLISIACTVIGVCPISLEMVNQLWN